MIMLKENDTHFHWVLVGSEMKWLMGEEHMWEGNGLKVNVFKRKLLIAYTSKSLRNKDTSQQIKDDVTCSERFRQNW